jgi:predicted amidophosphoribosyltransferase
MCNPWRLFCDTLWPEPEELHAISISKQPELYKQTYFLLSYRTPSVKTTIRNNKFHFHSQSAKNLARVADHFLQKYPNASIIPIPSSPARERKRGYQHLLHILQYSQYRHNVQIAVLKKIRNTPQQSRVSKETRLQQQHNTFACHIQNIPKQCGIIILFDDVVTTEATMHAAYTCLKPHVPAGTKILCFALAH